MQPQQSQLLQQQIVVFSKNYLPLARINIKRAIVLLVTGQAESLAYSGQQWEVRSPSVVLQVPEHIRLTVSNPERHWKLPPVSRREIFRRDQQRCQYCGSHQHLTLDHVIPVLRAARTAGITWLLPVNGATPVKVTGCCMKLECC